MLGRNALWARGFGPRLDRWCRPHARRFERLDFSFAPVWLDLPLLAFRAYLFGRGWIRSGESGSPPLFAPFLKVEGTLAISNSLHRWPSGALRLRESAVALQNAGMGHLAAIGARKHILSASRHRWRFDTPVPTATILLAHLQNAVPAFDHGAGRANNASRSAITCAIPTEPWTKL